MCVCSVYIRSNRLSPATESSDTLLPLPDSAFHRAVEAKERVAGACTVATDDKGITKINSRVVLSVFITLWKPWTLSVI